jgi:nitrogen-specific signal transduction histidine kinase
VGRVDLDADGKPARAVGITIDNTDRHVLEEQYQQSQKMEAVGRLAAGVAHDFNNCLTVILGYSEYLLSELRQDDPHRSDIAEIQRAGSSAARVTQQLLAFSRKQIVEPTLLDLSLMVAEKRSMLERLIGDDVQVCVRFHAGAVMVQADRGQIEQIIMNLAVNARDAMPHGGRLTIATGLTELDEEYAAAHFGVIPGSYVVLTVTDSGTGMTSEVQSRLFEPFFTTKAVGKGTGLGLATVHGIVKQSGGSIGVYSEVGRGTTFKVYFPRVDTLQAAVPVEAPVDAGTARKVTVLVVEDSEGLRKLTQKMLVRLGHAVLLAAGADEALQLIKENPSIEVMLSDVVMPETSGPELVKIVSALHPALRVIYMSGYTEDAIVQHGVLMPGIQFLHKPFTADALGLKIRDVLRQ